MLLISLTFEVSYSVTLDGTTIHSVDNSDARVFNDVKVLAGDDFYPEADATYKNLGWEESLGKLDAL